MAEEFLCFPKSGIVLNVFTATMAAESKQAHRGAGLRWGPRGWPPQGEGVWSSASTSRPGKNDTIRMSGMHSSVD